MDDVNVGIALDIPAQDAVEYPVFLNTVLGVRLPRVESGVSWPA
jgi:hypothetical protein